jgi:hypothetical protein
VAHAREQREELRIENAVIDHGRNLMAQQRDAKLQKFLHLGI